MASQSVNEQHIVIIKFHTLIRKSFSEIWEDLDVYGDSCLSNGSILKRVNPLNEGRETTEDGKHTGRQKR